MRKVLKALVAVVALAVIVVVAAVAYVRSAGPVLDGELRLRGLTGEVEIWRDSLGVPHIWAGSAEDLFFAQGFVHAQDRLWQMELFRRAAQGRLAEVMGEDLVETDLFLRNIGLWRAALAAEASLDDVRRRWAEAYVAGVNAAIEARKGALPPEFLVLRIEPEPWTLQHSLALEKLIAWDLAAYGATVELARAARRLGADRARILAPDYPDWGATILDAPLPPEVPAVAAALLDALSITRASNAWVIHGRHTRSGKPILANDMHLELRSPSLWYLAALHGGGFDVAGMMLPGVPFVIAGHNRAIAWGFTNAYVDDVDLFVERLDPADSTRYLTPWGSEPFEVVEETIAVRGRDEPVRTTLRWTRHGPVLTPLAEWDAGEVLAMRWVGHDPGGTWRAFAGLNLAEDWESFVRAIDDFDNPHQNVVYADTAGNIGYDMGGTVPIRGAGRRPPLLPVPGWTGEWDWTGALPIEEHPHVLNPPEGFVVTANNRQVAGDVADRISGRWEEPFRAMRIREMLLAGGPFDADAVHRQQLDVRDAMADRYIDRAVEAAEMAGLADAASLLRSWDREARGDSRAAALFYTWQDRLSALAARSLYANADDGGDPLGGVNGWFPRASLVELLERRAVPWVDSGSGMAFRELAARAIAEADSIVDGRTWGEIHEVVAAHALGVVPILERVLGLDVGPAPHGGSPTTVNVSHHVGGGYPVKVRYAASQRHVVDMGDIDGAGGFILPTGQSGLPFSPHYRDQFNRWREGGLWRIPLDREKAERLRAHTLILKPEE